MHFYPNNNQDDVRGHYYYDNAEKGCLYFKGVAKQQADGSFAQRLLGLSVYGDKVSGFRGTLKNGVMTGKWMNATGIKRASYRLVLQRDNKDLAKQKIYNMFKQKFCQTSLAGFNKKESHCNNRKDTAKITTQEIALFFTKLADVITLTTPNSSSVQRQAYLRLGYYQSQITLNYHIQHPSTRFDVLVFTISGKEGGSTYSPWCTNTFVVTFDKFGNHLSSVFLAYHQGWIEPRSQEELKNLSENDSPYTHHEASDEGSINAQWIIDSRSPNFPESSKSILYKILPNGDIVKK